MQNYLKQRVITSSDFRDGGCGFDYHDMIVWIGQNYENPQLPHDSR
jgi:hypothetical protein